MRTFSIAANPRSALIAALLMLAMLGAQWVGLTHRVEHADWRQAASAASVLSSDSGKDVTHSCTLFDAATLAFSLHTPSFIAPLLSNVRVLALWAAFSSWSAPFTCHFSSRAPPLA
jgi:hypothetical protein